jgi:hypothetical protein
MPIEVKTYKEYLADEAEASKEYAGSHCFVAGCTNPPPYYKYGDEPNTGSEIDRIEHAIKYGMQKIAYRNFRAYQSFVTKEKECIYSEYFTYASKLPKSQRFGKSSMILSQVLNLLKYQDCADKFKPLKFTPHLVEID